MSNRTRIGLIAAAVVVAVAAVVIASSGGNDKSKNTASTTTSTGAAKAPAPAAPKATVIKLVNHAPVGGKVKLTAKKGERVEFTVVTDSEDQIHLHGYDIEKVAKAGKPAKFAFKAKIDGLFDIESHTAEHLGKQPAVAELTVNP
jgi:ABC-type antimicrobial peptide transport system permease subunit